MRELQDKQRLKRRLYSLPALILLAFIAFLFVRGTYIVFTKKSESGRYVDVLEARATAFRSKQIQLETDIKNLETPEGIEKEVKAKYNVAKEGEHVVILVDKQATSSENAAEPRTWYRRMWSAIMSAL